MQPVINARQEKALADFLNRSISANVCVLNSGLGLTIFYTSTEVKSVFILHNLWLFRRAAKENAQYCFEEFQGEEALLDYRNLLERLTALPQFFLSCIKKMTLKFQYVDLNTDFNSLLYDHYTDELELLLAKKQVPFEHKIRKIRENKALLDLKTKPITILAQDGFPGFHFN